MIQPAAFHEALAAQGFTFFTGVPDSLLKDLCAFIADHVPAEDNVVSANEGGAVALAAGYHLATGEMPVVYLQNSGIGNVVNPLLSLVDPGVYRIPVLFVIGWRGEPGIADEPQHITQGKVMKELLTALGLQYDVLDAGTPDPDVLIARIRLQMAETGRPHALLVRKGTFAPYQPADVEATGREPSRPEAIRIVLGQLDPSDVVISTTGMTSREVFAYRAARDESHRRDFLTVGSMGHCSQIALGVARQRPLRGVYCLDGDGAVLMHMGSLAVIGTQQPSNFRHIVINNGAHDSVGGQPTAAREIAIGAIALACGYRRAESIVGVHGIAEAMSRLRESRGPAMLEIRVASRARTDAGRPTSSPLQNKADFMTELGV